MHRRRKLLVAACWVALAVLAFLAWRTGSSAGDPSQKAASGGGSDAPSAVTSPEVSVPSSSYEEGEIPKLSGRRVQNFLEVYFSREPMLTEEVHAKRILPYATEEFMQQFYRFEPLQDGVARIEVEFTGLQYGSIEFPSNKNSPIFSEQSTGVRLLEYRSDDSVPKYELTQATTWELTPKGWKIRGM